MTVPIRGIFEAAGGVESANNSNNTKNATNMLIPTNTKGIMSLRVTSHCASYTTLPTTCTRGQVPSITHLPQLYQQVQNGAGTTDHQCATQSQINILYSVPNVYIPGVEFSKILINRVCGTPFLISVCDCVRPNSSAAVKTGE